MTHIPKPPRITQFPPIQGQLDRPPAKWVNQRELGRLFGLSSTVVKAHLEAMGWRIPGAGVSDTALSKGIAKPIFRYGYQRQNQEPEKVVSGYRWNVEKAVPALAARGLTPLSRLDTLAHSLADIMVRDLRSVVDKLQKKTGKSAKDIGKEEALEEMKRWQWSFDRVQANLSLVSESNLPSLLAGINKLLLQKKVHPPHAEALLETVGYLHSLREWEMDQALEEAPERFSGHRPAQRF